MATDTISSPHPPSTYLPNPYARNKNPQIIISVAISSEPLVDLPALIFRVPSLFVPGVVVLALAGWLGLGYLGEWEV